MFHLIDQQMPLIRRQMSSHQSTNRHHGCRQHGNEGKVDSNSPVDVVANSPVGHANGTVESKDQDLTNISSSADKKQIAALMASTATIATEASSIAPSIETTFMAAAATAATQNSTSRFDTCKRLGDSLASLSLSDLDFAEAEQLDTNNAPRDSAPSTNQIQQDTMPIDENDENEFYENLSDAAENKFLRPRTKELHHYALAMDIVGDLDDDDADSDDESTADDDTDTEELLLSSLKEGLEFIYRPRKSEKHIFALSEFLLDGSDSDSDSEDGEGEEDR